MPVFGVSLPNLRSDVGELAVPGMVAIGSNYIPKNGVASAAAGMNTGWLEKDGEENGLEDLSTGLRALV